MNYVWFLLIMISLLTAAITGKIEQLPASAFEMAGAAVNIVIGLIGILTFWLGLMRIAENAGLIRLLARWLTPIGKHLFPDVPAGHPAMGSMTLNIAANWLGLGNAATPFGIKAMEHLQELNPEKTRASDAMIMFMGLNTSSITLVPITIIGVRTSLGSADPGAIIGTTLFSSICATIAAIAAVKVLTHATWGLSALGSWLIRAWKWWTSLMLFILLILFLRHTSLSLGSDSVAFFRKSVDVISKWTIPLLLLLILGTAAVKKVKVYEVFIDGAKEGFQVAIRIIPYLVAILAAIALFRTSGAMDMLITILTPFTQWIGFPAEVLPAALMRPFSGSGTLGIITELMKSHTPDSFIGCLSSTIYGCTETTFYVLAVYFGAVGIRQTRFAVAAGLFADGVGILASLFICRLIFL